MVGAKTDAKTDERVERRTEADIVRLEAERLKSGLFRHRLVKFIMELSGKRRSKGTPQSR